MLCAAFVRGRVGHGNMWHDLLRREDVGRVIDGALGAELLKHIVDNLENPMAMLA